MKQRKPTRLKNFNYSLVGYYFITICAHNHLELFGSISEEITILNKIGKIVEQKLHSITEIYNDAVIDDCYTIMPNHLHFILIINKPNEEDTNRTKMYVSKIIQLFKSACTKEIRNEHNMSGKIWQKSYYDRVIRTETELQNIRKYIAQNPLAWHLEKSTPENLEL